MAGRRRKQLIDLVRDGTFLARKDDRLLGGTKALPWPALEKFRKRYRRAPADERRGVALELERALGEPDGQVRILGRLEDELGKLGPHRSFEQLVAFFPWAMRHQAGPHAGEPFRLVEFELNFLREFFRRRPNGERVYSTGLFAAPKGTGKTPLIAGLGLYALVTETDAPEVYDLAGSADQADIAGRFARKSIETGPLAAWIDASNIIRCDEHGGELHVLSSAGDLGHGTQPTAAFFDEKWLFRHREQREAVNAQEKALHKRPGQAYALSFSTAGWTKDSLLGEEYDALIEHPQLERLDDGFLLVVRDEAAGYLGWWHGAPEDADFRDPDVVRRANPAPWVRPDDLLRSLQKPGQDENDWRRLHTNSWTRAKVSWLSSGVWDRLRSNSRIPGWRGIPDGVELLLGIDAARSFATTAIGCAWIAPDGKTVLRSHVWSVRSRVPHHEYVEGGELINEVLVEPFVHALAERYTIRGIGFDPRYFSAEARHLADAGFTVIEVQPQSSAMGDAVVKFEKDALGGTLEHDGDHVLASHVEAIDALRRADGSKKIGARSDRAPIDAAIAVILANYLSELDLPEQNRELAEPMVAFA